jgi:hypothetical protein
MNLKIKEYGKSFCKPFVHKWADMRMRNGSLSVRRDIDSNIRYFCK